jgi:hypothetical protein
MKIILRTSHKENEKGDKGDPCKYFFLTCANELRRQHFLKEFADLNVTEVNPVMGIDRILSGVTGFSRMLDLAIHHQDRTKPFQPFMILEDDVKKYREFPESIEIPDDADFLYVGLSYYGMSNFSHCYDVFYKNVDSNTVRVFNMLSIHGLIICSIRGLVSFQKCMLESYYKNEASDITVTHFQPYINAYALRVPLVYQLGDIGGQEAPTKIEFQSPDRANIPEHWINTTNISFLTTHPEANATHPLRL